MDSRLAKALFATGTLTIALTGCSELDRLRDLADSPAVQRITSLTVAGVTPADDYRSTGRVNFEMLPESTDSDVVRFANLQQEGMKVEVKNDDGTYSECEYVDGEEVVPLEHHTMPLLLDGSGSMELAYPPDEYGDVCLTCPHDPHRDRIVAADELVSVIHDASPRSRMAVAEFGPGASPGYRVTHLHSLFITDTDELSGALDAVRGDERVGTPLYDSLAEMIGETRDEAKSFEATLRRERGEDIPWEEQDPADDVPEAERECARSIVVLSDGEDNESTLHDVDSVIELARDAGVDVFVVGLGPASASTVDDAVEPEQTRAVRDLQRLARDTGGFYAAAQNSAQLRELYDSIGRALTQGYQKETYECVPKPAQDSPDEEATVPPVGSRVDGRVRLGETTIPWVTIAN